MKLKAKIAAAALAVGTVSAHAALPADAQAALDGITVFADDMISWAWPVVGTVILATVGIKLVKRFVNKAT